MEMLLNAVNWVEIPVTDFERAKKFYSAIYDYEMPEMMMGPIRMGFLLFEQTGGIGAAIAQGEWYKPSKDGARVYLNGGSDLSIVLTRVESAGGKVMQQKFQISPELGHVAIFEDTEGNIIALHSAK
jgi:predicted enzyme related to lactoylglutathione lyase